MAITEEAALASAVVAGEVCMPISVTEQVEFCYARGWTDGLPVVPATAEPVAAMLEAAALRPDAVLAEMPSRNVVLTAEKVAINAVMAGCKPEYMPVIAAAVKALGAPEFGLHHVASGHSGATIIVLVNGPIAARLGINSTNNVFGPGVRANATIGRAVRVMILNLGGAKPNERDKGPLGHPGRFSYCIGEDEE
ncbi:MAG: hypothetical protein Q7R45_17690, partial [Sulfuricaulis sp.]|nr:hypothetical protein [Sulfuricaulis sp.]